ncbi:MAG: GldG family protein [Acidobacteriota bacterium]
MSRRKRRLRGSTESIAVVILVAVGLVLLNAISARVFTRLDLTEGKIYTLSNSSRTVLSRLDDIIRIEAYFRKKSPPPVERVKQHVEDLLAEYVAYAKGNLRVEWIDPIGNPQQEARARSLGIPEVQIQGIERDEAKIIRGYMGLAILFEDRTEIVPLNLSTATLEYQITSAILKISTRERLKVGILSPSNQEQADSLQLLHQGLRQQYDVVDVTLAGEEDSIPENLDTLIVVGVQELSERGKWEIDQFVMRGKRVFFLADAVEVPTGSMTAYPRSASYAELLQHYGITVNSDLVLDASSALARLNTGAFGVYMQYRFWVKVIPDGFNQDNPAVSELTSLVLPWTSSISISAVAKEQTVELASSTEQAWVQEGFFNLSPNQRFGQMAGNFRKVPLAVVLTGKLGSFYRGQAPPAGVTPGQGGQPDRLDESVTESQLVVVGSSRWATDFFVQQYPTNLAFLLNCVDWLTLGPDLIEVRSRGGVDRPLEPLDEDVRVLLKFFNVVLMPGAVVLFGIVWYLIRRRARRMVEAF